MFTSIWTFQGLTTKVLVVIKRHTMFYEKMFLFHARILYIVYGTFSTNQQDEEQLFKVTFIHSPFNAFSTLTKPS